MTQNRSAISYQELSLDSDCLDDVWELNQRFAADMSSLTRSQLSELISQSTVAMGAIDRRRCVGFILAFGDHSSYAGENFRWFQKRYDSFLYVDRVAVRPEYQGRSIAHGLYQTVADCALRSRLSAICCEVNLMPPNEASLRFHDTIGFVACGTRHYRSKNRHVQMLVLNESSQLGRMLR